MKKNAEALSRRTKSPKNMLADICHTAGDFMAAGVSKTTFLMSFWCPGTHPEVSGHPPGDTRRSERGPDRIQGGPASVQDDFWSPFGSSGDTQRTTFGVLFCIFPVFLLLFRRFFSRALFGVVFGRFRDPPEPSERSTHMYVLKIYDSACPAPLMHVRVYIHI